MESEGHRRLVDDFTRVPPHHGDSQHLSGCVIRNQVKSKQEDQQQHAAYRVRGLTSIPDDVEKPHRMVQDFYGEAAVTPRTGLCCPVSHDPADTAHIPEAVLERFYGCGSPVTMAEVHAGETVVDLGSGGGIDCFIASRRVGPAGKVIGVDMTDEMLGVAERNLPLVAEKLGVVIHTL